MVNPRVPIEASRSGACADETKAGDRFVKDDYILCRGRRPRRPDADSPKQLIIQGFTAGTSRAPSPTAFFCFLHE